MNIYGFISTLKKKDEQEYDARRARTKDFYEALAAGKPVGIINTKVSTRRI